MKKSLFGDMEIPEDIRDEVILLYNLGVGLEELKYILFIRLSQT